MSPHALPGKTRVKICGIKDPATIRDMNGLPVDYIGFVFAPSKRRVDAEQAARLHAASRLAAMRDGRAPRTVGVFVNPSMDELADVLRRVPLDVVQLHGEETPPFCREVQGRFGVDVWRAFPVSETSDVDLAEDGGVGRLEAYAGIVSAALIDTAGGGTGRAFRWDLVPAYLQKARSLGLPLFVAGGLTPDNVAELLAGCRPDGVDVSSGVETGGTKDIEKISAFAERVNRS